jgi:1-deoxy-D-xylulose-5-phosphate reductoisomerase
LAVSVTILGSTGVIGTGTLDVVRAFGENYEVVALCAGRNAAKLAEQIRSFHPPYVSVQDEETRLALLDLLQGFSPLPEIGVGEDGLLEAAALPSDIVVSGIVGSRGMKPTWVAIARGAVIALANKETLVAAGDLVMPFARDCGAKIIPVDSEHCALFQCLLAGRPDEVANYTLTASGGPFRTWTPAQLRTVTVEQALKHPNWSMGQKITIDSASLMNKGLEVIEAHHLFGASYDQIRVLVHPQSMIHSMVEFVDGSTLAQLASPDMRLPIQYALTYPERFSNPWPRIDWLKVGPLTFEAPDLTRFPSLGLAYAAGRQGGYAPCVLNAANEIAVNGFLDGRISFRGMAKLVESMLERNISGTPRELNDIVGMDNWARTTAQELLEKGGWKD